MNLASPPNFGQLRALHDRQYRCGTSVQSSNNNVSNVCALYGSRPAQCAEVRVRQLPVARQCLTAADPARWATCALRKFGEHHQFIAQRVGDLAVRSRIRSASLSWWWRSRSINLKTQMAALIRINVRCAAAGVQTDWTKDVKR
jgi:hypothetical protein